VTEGNERSVQTNGGFAQKTLGEKKLKKELFDGAERSNKEGGVRYPVHLHTLATKVEVISNG